jgi:hypothetical protein
VSNPEVRFFILIGSLENKAKFCQEIKFSWINKFKRVLFSTKIEKNSSLKVVFFNIEWAYLPLEGSFGLMTDYFEKGSKVA